MSLTIEKTIILLLISSCIGIICRRIKIPYTVGLLLGGLLSTIIAPHIHVEITKELIYTLLLPPLIFEAAIHLKVEDLKREYPLVATIAVFGSIVSAIVAALLIIFFSDITFLHAFIIGIILSATDPVSVIATLKESKANRRLRFLIESESLFNDGAIVIIFGLLSFYLAGNTLTYSLVSILLLKSTIFSVIISAALTLLVLVFIGRTSDRLIEIALSTVCAYLTFLTAEHFQGSGIISCLVSGIIFRNYGFKKAVSYETQTSLIDSWEYFGFLANSFIFITLGMQITNYNFTAYWKESIIVFISLIFARAFAVYLSCYPFKRTSLKISFLYQNILIWGGLRGALAVVLAISLPTTLIDRDLILCIVLTVVASSIVIQGLTVGKLISKG